MYDMFQIMRSVPYEIMGAFRNRPIIFLRGQEPKQCLSFSYGMNINNYKFRSGLNSLNLLPASFNDVTSLIKIHIVFPL